MANNPRGEANAKLGGRYDARVLEPSPPAVTEGPWFSDDPVGERSGGGLPVVSPVPGGDLLWSEVVDGAALEQWCRERWLIPGWLAAAPASLAHTRTALHRLAEHVISPARREVNGKIGLRYTRGGFGTPFFGQDVQVRVEGTELVVVRAGEERRAPITTLSAAARHVGLQGVSDAGDPDGEPLEVDAESARFLGEWYGFAALVLETLRAESTVALEPSRVQLWPEHFDLALELGSEAAGARAAYGCSPGDEQHPEPYIYVAPWQPPPEGELWQASGFRGAELGYAELLAAPDPVAVALEFLRARVAALVGT
jgi:hypothetical protein